MLIGSAFQHIETIKQGSGSYHHPETSRGTISNSSSTVVLYLNHGAYISLIEISRLICDILLDTLR